MIVFVPRETAASENRVAIAPDGAKALVKLGLDVRIEPGAGVAAGFDDAAYVAAGAKLEPGALAAADLVLKVQAPSDSEIARLKSGAALVALMRPLDDPQRAAALAKRGVTTFALELIPRITRAQSMDVLSSQATIAGYRAVLLAALRMPKLFPMMVTAAGTITSARVFVIGAGVAGLQAIATAKRLGGVVEAYDTRAAAAEQIESLGARFVKLELDAGDAQDAGGYAKAQSEEFYAKQRALMAATAAKSDVVITTALVPGQRAPLLIDEAGVRGMKRGAVVVDLAAANGGNVALTNPGGERDVDGVLLLGPLNLPAEVPGDASRLFSRNVVTLVTHLVKDAKLALDLADEITRGTLLTHAGEITQALVKERAGA
ncbi:MAG: Re/Si-specific NAD(P)(+) transhydrogenase subunit alpha [Deltaproteobacteria bacterium]|nr:Re/Si-specific NAD(P)(+) transhydrogenase subunit alpha [Deltaproteobacteria bacterium]